MRSVRCDACGTKALMAASKCPKCGHGFEVRDGFGELVPLAHCASCDSYYPAHIGSCKWCGTKPERSVIGPLGPYLWKAVGALTFASLAIGAWLAKRDTPSTAAPVTAPAPTFVADTLPTNQPAPVSIGRKVAARVDTVGIPDSAVAIVQADSAVAADDSESVAQDAAAPPVSLAPPVTMQSAGTVAPPESTVVVDPAPAPAPSRRTIAKSAAPAPTPAKKGLSSRATPRTPAKTLAKAPAKTPKKSRAVVKAPSRSRSTGRWVVSVARNWAIVRADPNRRSRIIASIGPNTRVQLGETRGDWRRIRAKGLSGWVEHRTLAVRTIAPLRPGRLAAR